MRFRFDEFELDPDRLELRKGGVPVRADSRLVRLLHVLVRNADKFVTKAALLSEVWEGRAVSDNVVTVTMVRLRRILGQRTDARESIINLRGHGYRFVRPVTIEPGELAPSAECGPPRAHAESTARARDVRRLRSIMTEAWAGRGRACLLTGEAGIGKTHLAAWIAAEAKAAGVAVAWAYCQEITETPPLWPIAQLVQTRLASRWGALTADAPVPAALRWLMPATLAERPHRFGDQPTAKHELFEAILRVLGEGPCLLVIDDLHRADAASLEFLRYWFDRIERMRVLWVGAMRPLRELSPASHGELTALVAHGHCLHLRLDKLDRDAVAAYVAQQLPDPDERVARAVWAKSEGHPLFMVEMVRQWSDATDLGARLESVPDAVLDLIRPRMLALGAPTRALLSLAAVVGRRFDLQVLREVTNDQPGALMRSLDAAVLSAVVFPVEDAATEFCFAHELIRQVFYDALSAAEQRRLHVQVGAALERRRQTDRTVSAGVLAYHFHAALPEGDAAKTAAHCAAAAVDAAVVFAYADGLRYLQHARDALALLEHARPAEHMGIVLRQVLFARIAAPADFERLAAELTQLARLHGAGAMLVKVGLLLDTNPGFPALPRARETLELGLAQLAPTDEAPRAEALARLATAPPCAYDAGQCLAQSAEALALARGVGSAFTLYCARAAQLYLMGGPAHEDSADEAIFAFDELCRAHPVTLSMPPVLLEVHRAMRALRNGEARASSAALARAASRCRDLGAVELLWHVERFQALALVNAGDVATGLDALRLVRKRALSGPVLTSALLCAHDDVVLLGKALAPATRRLLLEASSEDPPNVWSIKARTLAAAGLDEPARRLLFRVPPEALAKLPCDRDYLGTLAALTRVSLAVAARGHAAALYTLLQPYARLFAVHLSFLCEGPVALLLAEIARALGKTSEADAHFRDALDVCEEHELGAQAARVRRAYAAVPGRVRRARPGE